MKFANVLLPLKMTVEVTYSVPSGFEEKVTRGSYVRVELSGREYTGMITEISETPPDYKGVIKEILSLENRDAANEKEIELLYWIAEYYMCTPGEVLRAASGNNIPRKKRTTSKNKSKEPFISTLSEEQQKAFDYITGIIDNGKPILLKGVTGSGKTEVYLKLASKTLNRGQDVLLMVPEVALSRQLTKRIEEYFPGKVLLYHSRQPAGTREEVRQKVRNRDEPHVILGLRSALFLPFTNLGLIIVDEEHDTSYKQNDPAPRYNGRDAAIVLAGLHKAGVVLGSATPSMESLYNCEAGKYHLCELKNKYYSAQESSVEIIDTIRETRKKQMSGLFSVRVLEEISKTIESGRQVLIFRNRRSYSPMVQCIYCGDIPKCKHCNVSLSYHKKKGVLQCHYCEYRRSFTTICTNCGKPGLKERGCGTEMIEEEISRTLPEAVCSRLDSETASSASEEKRILKDFSSGKSNILIGTQMVSKGFDFEKLSLIVLIQADSMLATEDFRAQEKAMQMFTQLAGRGGRRSHRGHIMIQTSRPDHPVFQKFLKGKSIIERELRERREFGYPPYKRLIRVVIKHRDKDQLNSFALKTRMAIESSGITEINGPFPPAVDRIRSYNILNLLLRIDKSPDMRKVKKTIYNKVNLLLKEEGRGVILYFDPDPL